jgi:ParB/RepB/Spo0J family partition protein
MDSTLAVHVPLDAITPSPLNPRREFAKADLAELAASIRENGVLQPILLRPAAGADRYELVAGERRWRAAREAGLPAIPAVVREIPDDQVLRLALLENLQRKDLHPVEEADALAALHKDGMAVGDLAAKLGKHPHYVYARMKLADLSPAARKPYRAGRITHAAALLVARLPNDRDRDAAARYIAERCDGTEDAMPTAHVRDYLDRTYMLRLEGARFPKDVENFVSGVPACTSCPKRTGNQRGLFADVKSAEVCTDPACFAAKQAMYHRRTREAALATGRTVITGDKAKALLPYSGATPKGYVVLDHRCHDDKKARTFRALLGKTNTANSTLIESPSGEFVEALPTEQAARILRQRGIKSTATTVGGSSSAVSQRAAEKKAKLESGMRRRIHEEIRKHVGRLKLEQILPRLAAGYFQECYGETQERLARLRGEEKRLTRERIHKLDADAALQVMVDLCLIPGTRVSANYTPSADDLDLFAKLLAIDAKSIRAEVTAAAEKKPAKASKPGRAA